MHARPNTATANCILTGQFTLKGHVHVIHMLANTSRHAYKPSLRLPWSSYFAAYSASNETASATSNDSDNVVYIDSGSLPSGMRSFLGHVHMQAEYGSGILSIKPVG